MKKALLIPTLVVSLLSTAAFAQTLGLGGNATANTNVGVGLGVGNAVRADVQQQTQVNAAVPSIQLESRDAARVQQVPTRIERTERAPSDASLDATLKAAGQTGAERRQPIAGAQVRGAQRGAIDVTAPAVAEGELQSNVSGKSKLEQRGQSGVANTALTARQVARLKRQQAREASKVAHGEGDAQANVREQMQTRAAGKGSSKASVNARHELNLGG